MAKYELKLPKMGESVAEATITSWLKSVGDSVKAEESIVEIATDKVDSDVPSAYSGILTSIKCPKGTIAKVGQTLAIIETDKEIRRKNTFEDPEEPFVLEAFSPEETPISEPPSKQEVTTHTEDKKSAIDLSSTSRFYSPLVKSIAIKKGITKEILEKIPASGLGGRLTKNDLLSYIEKNKKPQPKIKLEGNTSDKQNRMPLEVQKGDEWMTLTRMGKMISDHMLHSKNKAVHVQSVIDIDVTEMVRWRVENKDTFLQKTGQKLTFTPIFMMAVAKAIEQFPLVNLSFDGVDAVVVKKQINLGMAAALPDGNLIVPVIKKANELNLTTMATKVNDLASRAKSNHLTPDEIQRGTYTVTNIGAFRTIFGVPIINQPQSAILALGAIVKKPYVITNDNKENTIAIREIMYVTHSYDHRVINGSLGGQFILYLKQYLENWKNFPKEF